MKIRSKVFCIITTVSMLFISVTSYAHDGHKDEDMVVENLNGSSLGLVDFSVSCNPAAQKVMNDGVGLLHHMMYAQAELLFSQWIEKEPDCAMLYWGYSMTLFHPLWPDVIKDEILPKGQSALEKALELNTTERERQYINAALQYYKNWQTVEDKLRVVAWAKAQKLVYQKNPDDIDAAAFYALSQLAVASKKDPTFKQNREAGELLGKIRKISPTHPGAIHYTIHAYDNAPLAELAVDAARAYDQIAPDVPHALHMPSHVFVRLGMWSDVVSWNIRSAKAALKYPTKEATSMHYIHAIDYLIYGYLQLGEWDQATQALEQVESHHPIQATFPAAYAFAVMPARITLEQKKWHQASQLKVRHPDYIDWQKFPQIEAITYYARGLGAAMKGDLKSARTDADMLDVLYEKTKAISPDYWAPLVDAQRQVVNAWIDFGSGKKDHALAQLRQAADIEDSMDKNPVTPGAVLPARELLADMLFLNNEYSSAVAEYKLSLAISPNRLNSVSSMKDALSKMEK